MTSAARESPNSRSRSAILLIVGLLLALMVSVFCSREINWVRKLILSAGWFGWGISILIYAALGATPVPSEPITLLITTVFGPGIAILVAAVGNLLAAIVEYLIGGQVGELSNFESKKSRLPFGLGKARIDSPWFLICARMLPGYGPKFVAIAAGMYNVPLWRYCWTTAISTAIGAVTVAFTSFGLIQIPWIKGFIH